jgi:flavodoxin
MKKAILILLALLLTAPLAASGSERNEPKTTSAGSGILIAYFARADNSVAETFAAVDVDATTSASLLPPGNTARMAEYIKEEVGGDLFSIAVAEPYPRDYDECLDRAAKEKAGNARPALRDRLKNIGGYNVIFLGYPTWCYTAPMAVFSFIEEYDLSGKTVIPFCAHGTGGLADSVRDIAAALPNSRILKPIGIYRSDAATMRAKIKEWLSGLGLEAY